MTNTQPSPTGPTSSTTQVLPIRGVLVAIAFEALAVVVLAVIAEQSDKAGTLILWLLIAFWVLFLITHGNALGKVPTLTTMP